MLINHACPYISRPNNIFVCFIAPTYRQAIHITIWLQKLEVTIVKPFDETDKADARNVPIPGSSMGTSAGFEYRASIEKGSFLKNVSIFEKGMAWNCGNTSIVLKSSIQVRVTVVFV